MDQWKTHYSEMLGSEITLDNEINVHYYLISNINGILNQRYKDGCAAVGFV